MQNSLKQPTILAIDTSCDETSVAVVRGLTVLSNLLPSQMEYHREFGGVVPSLAKLAHQERISNVVEKSMKRANVNFKDIDAVAVTYGPGLAIALEVGLNKAKELAKKHEKPLVIVNHMEGHLLSSLAQRQKLKVKSNSSVDKVTLPLTKSGGVLFPVIGFLVSGGHTELILMKNFGDYTKIGETVDDSCGEAFDKCGRMLGLGYPAGPVISKFAKEHRKNISIEIVKNNQSTLIKAVNRNSKAEYLLPIPMINSGDLNFSFSGLKTAFNQLVGRLKSENKENQLTQMQTMDLCVAFEAAALEQLAVKLRRAIDKYNPAEVWLGGGVVASARLREVLRKVCNEQSRTRENKIKMKYPYTNKLTGDNAAMIGVAAYTKVRREGLNHKPRVGIYKKDFSLIDRDPSLSL